MEFDLELVIYGLTALASLTGAGYVLLRRKTGRPLPGAAPTRKEYTSLEDALAKTREGFWGQVARQFSGKTTISKKEIEELEEALYTSDLGPKTVDRLIRKVSERPTRKIIIWTACTTH